MTHLFAFSLAPWELVLRGTLIYWFLLLVFRFILRRDAGSPSITDILFVVLLGDAAQNGMIGQADTVSDAIVLLSTLMAWNYALDTLSYFFPALQWLTDPPPICIIRNGRVQRRNLRREHITDRELEAALREKGIDDPRRVRRMYLESSGDFTVVGMRRPT